MSWGYVAIGGATLVAGYMSSEAQSDAAATQAGASEAGVAEQRRQFNALQELLAPYSEGGEQALSAQQALLGLSGTEAQQQAINQLEQSPAFASLVQQGEEALLQNASATGGLRGGDLQGALAQYRPQLLAQLVQNQFQNLSGLTSIGQNAAAMTGNVGMQSASNIGTLLNQGAAAQAAAQLGQAQIYGDTIGNLAGLFASYQNRPQQNTGGTF